MATITNVIADASGFLPEAWALEALNVLRNQIVLAKVITRDTDMGEAGWQGKTLNIPYPGTFVAQDKVAGNAVTAQAPTGGATISLSLSKHKVVDFMVEDYAAAQSNSDLLSRFVQPAVIALAEQLETDLWSMTGSLSAPVVGTAGTDLSASAVRQMRKALNTAKAPMQDRLLVLSEKDEIGLLGDSNLAQFYAFADKSAVTNGQLPNLYGFEPMVSQLVPTNSNENTVVTIGPATGGTFTLSYGGQTTAAIAYNAAASAVQSALQALSSISANGVSVSGAAAGPYTVTFTGQMQANPTAITGNGAGLTAANFSVASGSPIGTQNVAMHKSAMMFAMRPFREIPTGSGVATATVVDDESGLAIRVLKQYKPEYRAEYVGFDILYGYVALRPNLGLVAIS